MKTMFATLLALSLSIPALALEEKWVCKSTKKKSQLPTITATVNEIQRTASGILIDNDMGAETPRVELSLGQESTAMDSLHVLSARVDVAHDYRDYVVQLLPTTDEDMNGSNIGKTLKGKAVVTTSTFIDCVGTRYDAEIYTCKIQLSEK